MYLSILVKWLQDDDILVSMYIFYIISLFQMNNYFILSYYCHGSPRKLHEVD